MRSKASYENLKQDTMIWKKNHPNATRHTQYKAYTKHYIKDANQKQLKRIKAWMTIGHKSLVASKKAGKTV